MTVEARLENIIRNVESLTETLATITRAVERCNRNIRELVHLAELHQSQIEKLSRPA